MNTHDIAAFLAVVETGSIVAASAKLNLTQPGVTRRVQNLERLLGADLLDRQSKPLKPTDAGRNAYDLGRQVLHAVEKLQLAFHPEAEIGGDLRLGIAPYLASASLNDPINRLRDAFPRLTIRIVSAWSSEIMDMVGDGRLDAGAVFLPKGEIPRPELTAQRIASQPIVVVASRDTPLPERPRLADLSALPWIVNQEGCGMRLAIRTALEARQLPFEVTIEATGADAQLSLVSRGIGIGLVTEENLRASRFRRQVRELKVRDFHTAVCAWMVQHQPAPRLAAPIQLFRDRLAAAMG